MRIRGFIVLLLCVCLPRTFAQGLMFAHATGMERNADFVFSQTTTTHKTLLVFAGDTRKVTCFSYGTKLFLRDSLSISRPDKKYGSILGCTVNHAGNPSLVWGSEDLKNICVQSFDLKGRNHAIRNFVMAYDEEQPLLFLNGTGSCFLLTIQKDSNVLILYDFSTVTPTLHPLDFSSYAFATPRGQNRTLSKLLLSDPPEFLDTDQFSPLLAASARNKIYLHGNQLRLTMDENPGSTRIFSVSLEDYTISESRILQPSFQKASLSNSFLLDEVLYQFKVSDSELGIQATTLDQKSPSVTYRTTSDQDSISFRNSPFFVQTPRNRLNVLSSTKKFLRRLRGNALGISVYRTGDAHLLMTLGGIRSYYDATDAILGGISINGQPLSEYDAEVEPQLETIFFESLFNQEFRHVPARQPKLYIDALSRFLETQPLTSYSVRKVDDFFVLATINPESGMLELRKFSDSRVLD